MKTNKRELLGNRYRNLVVTALHSEKYRGELQWVCKCDCGEEVILTTRGVDRYLVTKKCHPEKQIRHAKTGKSQTTEYTSWIGALDRCHNPKNKRFKGYGGRGIEVCDRWRNSFENFLLDMGLKPEKSMSLDRIDNNKGYSPENCRWATPEQQYKNTRMNVYIEYNGESKIIGDWLNQFGSNRSTYHLRVNLKGMDKTAYIRWIAQRFEFKNKSR